METAEEHKVGDIWTGEDSYGNTTTHRVTWVGQYIPTSGEPFTIMSLDHKPAAHVEWWFGQGYEPRRVVVWAGIRTTRPGETMNDSELKETIELVAQDIIGDLINLRLLDNKLFDKRLDLAALYVQRRLEALVEETKK